MSDAAINAINKDGNTALILAIDGWHTTMCELLVPRMSCSTIMEMVRQRYFGLQGMDIKKSC